MSTTFAFPASPTLNQVATLPDGNQAQWNGYAWVEVGQTGPVYPITIPLGGTNATTAAAARVNLGLDAATGERIAPDGTVTNPGMAFASEPGMGWFRNGAGDTRFAVGGVQVQQLLSTSTTTTSMVLLPRANGLAQVQLRNQIAGSANYNQLLLQQNADGSAQLATGVTGSAVRANLILDAPQILHNDGTIAAPGISFSSETGTGWTRTAANVVRFTVAGSSVISYGFSDPALGFIGLNPRAAGAAQINLSTGPVGAPNYNTLSVQQKSDGSGLIQTSATGSATRGNLTLDAPTVFATGSVRAPGGSLGFGFSSTSNAYFIPDAVQLEGVGAGTNAAYVRATTAGQSNSIQFFHTPGVNAGIKLFAGSQPLFVDNSNNAFNPQNTTAWQQICSREIKHDIADYEVGLDALLKVRTRTYRMNDDPDELRVGIVADEVEVPFPQSVSRKNMSGVPVFNMDPVLWAMVNSIKTLNARIVELEARLKAAGL